MKKLLIILILVALVVTHYCIAQQFDMKKMKEQFEKRKPQLDSMVADPMSFDMNFEKVSATTIDSIYISGWFIAGSKKNGSVLMVHGFDMNKSHMLKRAKFFNDLGMSVLLIDLRARGESGGDKTSSGAANGLDILAMATVYYRDYSTFGDLTFYGFSHGGRSALFASSESNKNENLILESPPYSLTESFRRTYKILQMPKFDEHDLEEAMLNLSNKTILLLIGDSDPTIIETEAKELVSYSKVDSSILIIFPDTAHHVFIDKNLKLYSEVIHTFINGKL